MHVGIKKMQLKKIGVEPPLCTTNPLQLNQQNSTVHKNAEIVIQCPYLKVSMQKWPVFFFLVGRSVIQK